ncbi:MAG: hypothetical protein A2234_02740 [Elusimicrobia bacterium RIFOXYA2_FULL_58_8]|nr:MAG: hypothetical protein A2285_00825 [Elusimicrobia bacterium RIFOXYA12_FULL_57_11]OGS12234.1 MAG: hypothetical protein A2234_02740 [Elusimicrobia bacterium RIFOXYA2_FULL_58_8]
MGKSASVRKNEIALKTALISEGTKEFGAILAAGYGSAPVPIVILGPSGSGRTTLARLIHGASGRTGEFISVSCAAYPGKELERELFGPGKTPPGRARAPGALALADGGTLFLDEIGAISLEAQARLVKAIQSGVVCPRCGKGKNTGCALISTTRHDPQNLVEFGKLNPDFLRCLSGLGVRLKPLREAKTEIMPLIARFATGKRPPVFSKEARNFLLSYDWPGNLRELKRFVEIISGSKNPGKTITMETAQNQIRWHFY